MADRTLTRREFLRHVGMLASALVLDLSTPFSPVAGASRRFAPSLKSEAQDPEDFARYLVLVVLDACRPEYFALAPMPNLESLAANGVTYTDAWTGSLVSTTGPAHVQMSTGTFPWRNGLFAMEWYDWELGKRVTPCTLEAVRRGEMARIVRESGVPTLAGLLKARYPNACVAATSAQKFYAAQGLGVGPADYILYSTPPPDLVPQALPGHIPSDKIMHDPRLRIRVKAPGDENIFAARARWHCSRSTSPACCSLTCQPTTNMGIRQVASSRQMSCAKSPWRVTRPWVN